MGGQHNYVMTRLIDDGSACSRTLALGRTFQWQWHLHFSPLGSPVLNNFKLFLVLLTVLISFDRVRSRPVSAPVPVCALCSMLAIQHSARPHLRHHLFG